MSIGIYLNGTTGLTDGTLEVPNDELGVTLGSVGSTATFHMRCASGYRTAQGLTVNAPSGCQVSADGNTFDTSIVYGAGTIEDVNVACIIKRVSRSSVGWQQLSITPHSDSVSVEDIPEAPLTFTPTVGTITSGGCRVTFSTTDPDGGTLTYKCAVTTSATAPTDWSGYGDVTSPHDVTGLTSETTYYAHVRAYDGTFAVIGTSASFATQSSADTTPPTLTGALTASAGDAQSVLDWPDATDDVGVTGYDVDYKLTSASEWTAFSPDPTASTCTVTGLVNGSGYDFRVRAYDAAGNTSGYLTASATPAFPAWSDDFGDASLDSALWGIPTGSAAGIVTESGGVLRVYSATGSDMGAVYAKRALEVDRSCHQTVRAVQTDTAQAQYIASIFDAAYTAIDSPPNRMFGVTIYGHSYTTYGDQIVIRYLDSGGVAHYWNPTSDTWETTAQRFSLGITTGSEIDVKFAIDLANGNYVITVTNVATSASEVATIAISSVRAPAANSDAFLGIADTSTSVFDFKWTNALYADGV